MSANSFPQTARKPARQYKFLIGAALIVGVIGYLIFFGISSTQQYYLTVGELAAKGSSVTGQGVRVGGNLVQASIQEDIKDNKISFAITDGKSQLPISYKGVVPDTFDKATEVIAEGKLNTDGTFVASTVLAKCPSKYDAANVPASAYQWQSFGSK